MASDGGQRQAGEGQPAGVLPVPAVLEQDFYASSLDALRSTVAAHAATAGLAPSLVYDVVAVAHELAANAVRHGAGHGHLRLEAGNGVLTCQVSDGCSSADGGNPDAMAPPWPAEHGHGLWLVGRVADQFTIHHSPVGTTATAVFTLASR